LLSPVRRTAAVLATIFALCAWKGAAAESCQDVLKVKAKPITFEALYNIVAGKQLSKDEFEPTVTYKKRIKEAISSAISEIKQITGHELIVTSYPVYPFKTKYDADTRRMTVKSSSGLISLELGAYAHNPISWIHYAERDDQTSMKETGSYVGSNAFGVTKTITKRDTNTYVIGLSSGDALAMGWPSSNPVEYSLAMDPDYARQAKDRLEIILVGELVYPFAFNILHYESPTLGNPFETNRYIHGTAIDVRCGAFINGIDGKYLQKFRDNHDGYLEKVPSPDAPPLGPRIATPQPMTPSGSRSAPTEVDDVVREQISRCWNVPAGARDAKDLVVQIRVLVDRDGTVQQATIEDQARLGRDPLFRAAAESARRAFFNPQCRPLHLPPEKYAIWKELVVDFSTRP